MIISKTPLRISFVGGGSDISDFYRVNSGKVISSAINKHVYVIVRDRFDDKIVVNYSVKEIVNKVEEIKHELVREALKITGLANLGSKGIEITTLADIPSEGSGLGSSSAVTVVLLRAFYGYMDVTVAKERLAKEACEIEIDILKKPIGKQDQYASAFGGLNNIVFNSDDSVLVSPVMLNENQYRSFSSSILLFYTNISRKADDILTEQQINTKSNFEGLCNIVNLVDDFNNCLVQHRINDLGELLHQNWRIKKSFADKISNSEIDEMYITAMNAGATGGKIAGAGGGGFLLLFVPIEKQNTVRAALSKYHELHFELDKLGSRIVYDSRV